MQLLDRTKIWLDYAINGKTRYLTHSPFVFAFQNELLFDGREFYVFEQIEFLKAKLLSSKDSITIVEMGAAGGFGQSKQVPINHLANNISITPKYGKLLFKLVNHFQPQHILEVGTGLGISTAYMASVNKRAKLITLEGNEATAKVAMQNFGTLGLKNIEVLTGEFNQTLPLALAQLGIINLAFIDGNHQSQATLYYFEQCLQHINAESIIVFDDINWSADMHQAWLQIAAHPRVKLAIGLYRMGIVFFRDEFRARDYVQLYY